MIKLNNQIIRDYLKTKGWEPEPNKLHILGLREVDIYPEERAVVPVARQMNRYNDAIILFGKEFEMFRASVDPGLTWTQNPSNPKGCAHLTNGRWLYQIGLHKGKVALTQAAEVTVRRDTDRDGIPDANEPLHTGWFGINIHAGGATPEVNSWSAGCQVIWGSWQGTPWQTFIQACQRSLQRTFDYYLVDGVGLVR